MDACGYKKKKAVLHKTCLIGAGGEALVQGIPCLFRDTSSLSGD